MHWYWATFNSVQISCSVMSNSLWLHGLQHDRLPCPSPTPGACSNSCQSSRWCHPTISSSVVPFSSSLQSFSTSGSFLSFFLFGLVMPLFIYLFLILLYNTVLVLPYINMNLFQWVISSYQATKVLEFIT